jgi:hypothetical protein
VFSILHDSLKIVLDLLECPPQREKGEIHNSRPNRRRALNPNVAAPINKRYTKEVYELAVLSQRISLDQNPSPTTPTIHQSTACVYNDWNPATMATRNGDPTRSVPDPSLQGYEGHTGGDDDHDHTTTAPARSTTSSSPMIQHQPWS